MANNDEASSAQAGGQEIFQQGSISSPDEFLRFLHQEAKEQHASCPGSWNMGWCHSERGTLRRFLAKSDPVASEMQSMWTWLSHRRAQQLLAERLLEYVNLPPPSGCQNILSWDLFAGEHNTEMYSLRRRYYSKLFDGNVAPDPTEPGQGHWWPYSLMYIAAALAEHVDECKAMENIELMVQSKLCEVPV